MQTRAKIRFWPKNKGDVIVKWYAFRSQKNLISYCSSVYMSYICSNGNVIVMKSSSLSMIGLKLEGVPTKLLCRGTLRPVLKNLHIRITITFYVYVSPLFKLSASKVLLCLLRGFVRFKKWTVVPAQLSALSIWSITQEAMQTKPLLLFLLPACT